MFTSTEAFLFSPNQLFNEKEWKSLATHHFTFALLPIEIRRRRIEIGNEKTWWEAEADDEVVESNSNRPTERKTFSSSIAIVSCRPSRFSLFFHRNHETTLRLNCLLTLWDFFFSFYAFSFANPEEFFFPLLEGKQSPSSSVYFHFDILKERRARLQLFIVLWAHTKPEPTSTWSPSRVRASLGIEKEII